MNWGYKILIVYLIFVSGILVMVYKSSTQKLDMVTSDYYAKELKYQEKIEEASRVAGLSSPLRYQLEDHILTIIFPNDFSGKLLKGEAVLYCPSNEDKDIRSDFSVLDTVLVIHMPYTRKGLFELHLSWKADELTYYLEKKLFF